MARFWEMPAASPTMELGLIVAWRLPEGQAFASGTLALEVGTDKANMEVEIYEKGTMLRHLAVAGDEVPPGFPIAIVGEPGEDISALVAEFEARRAKGPAVAAAKPAAPAEAPRAAAPAAPAPVASPAPTSADRVERTWMGRTVHELFTDPPGDIRYGAKPSAVRASPLAKKIAAERGLDLRRVRGSGPGGRIVRADVEGAPLAAAPAVRGDEVQRHTPMRRTIAKRLLQSHAETPVFFLTVDLDMAGFVALREQLKVAYPDDKLSYNDLFLFATAKAALRHPEVNASWGDEAITRRGSVDLGVAVALPQGLITPVIRQAENLDLRGLASQVRELVKKARDGKLQPEEYSGNSITVSNLGMFGIEQFTAIVNPPASVILAVGALRQEPVVSSGGQIVVGHRMKVTMSCDHRVVDGAVGATFLQTLRRFVEAPAAMWV